VILPNDKIPRAINLDGTLKADSDWIVGETRIKYGASLGAGSIVLPGLTVGRFAMVGAGSVVTRDVPGYGLCGGNPARLIGFVCPCGSRLRANAEPFSGEAVCGRCDTRVEIPTAEWSRVG
jgi:UDP-2-acetamido-3-amino-2,3-dideoxy-glucuronate N-acetyltransferase